MLDRIRRKLFLSLKVIGSAEVSSSEDPSLGTGELLDILRRGSSALSTEGDEMTLEKFLKAPIEDILEISRKTDKVKDAKIKSELPAEQVNKVKTEDDAESGPDPRTLQDIEEEEMRLLKGIALVQSRLFEGKLVQRGAGNKDIARAWEDVQTRAKVDRLVTVNGIQVVAEHIAPFVVSFSAYTSWRLTSIGLPQMSEAKPVKKGEGKPKFEHEDWCNSCRDGGELVMCYRCPRGNVSGHTTSYMSLTGLGIVFHPGCYGFSKAHVARTPMMMCSQHKCHLCFRTTGDAGGMLFRCVFPA
jgi:SWI/SNF-related matrix-associated actin-dependent regulator of chromatin subfamily A member 5